MGLILAISRAAWCIRHQVSQTYLLRVFGAVLDLSHAGVVLVWRMMRAGRPSGQNRFRVGVDTIESFDRNAESPWVAARGDVRLYGGQGTRSHGMMVAVV